MAAGSAAITWGPRTVLLPPAPPVSEDALAVSTVSVFGVSAWLVAVWAAAAAAPAAIAEISSRPRAALVGCLRCCPPRRATPTTSAPRGRSGCRSVRVATVVRGSTSVTGAASHSGRRSSVSFRSSSSGASKTCASLSKGESVLKSRSP